MVDLPQPDGPVMRPIYQGRSSSGRFTSQRNEQPASTVRSNSPATCATRGVGWIDAADVKAQLHRRFERRGVVGPARAVVGRHEHRRSPRRPVAARPRHVESVRVGCGDIERRHEHRGIEGNAETRPARAVVLAPEDLRAYRDARVALHEGERERDRPAAWHLRNGPFRQPSDSYWRDGPPPRCWLPAGAARRAPSASRLSDRRSPREDRRATRCSRACG